MNSIHTFELRGNLTVAGYQLCRNHFFKTARNARLSCCCYVAKSKVVCNLWLHHGVIIYLKKNAKNRMYASIYFRINPNIMMSDFISYSLPSDKKQRPEETFAPNSLYKFDPDKNQRVVNTIQSILRQLPVNLNVDDLSLARIDLCEDFTVPDTNTLSSYLRVTKKGMHHPNWATESFGDERDDHSIRRKSKRYQLTIYDKTYQMQKQFPDFPIDPTKAILRIEVALLKKGIKHMAKKYEIEKGTWHEMLFGLLQNGSIILGDILDKLLSSGNYFTLSEAKTIIMNSDYREDRKIALVDFLTGINRYSVVSKYEFMQESSSKLRVKQLATLGINITTLDARSNIPALPSIQALIRHPQAYFWPE